MEAVDVFIAAAGLVVTVVTVVVGAIWKLSSISGKFAARMDVQTETLRHMDISMTGLRSDLREERDKREASVVSVRADITALRLQVERLAVLSNRVDKISDRVRRVERAENGGG